MTLVSRYKGQLQSERRHPQPGQCMKENNSREVFPYRANINYAIEISSKLKNDYNSSACALSNKQRTPSKISP